MGNSAIVGKGCLADRFLLCVLTLKAKGIMGNNPKKRNRLMSSQQSELAYKGVIPILKVFRVD